MRRRPWVLVVALLILALTFSIVVGIRYLNRSNRLRDDILKTFSEVPGVVSIGSATLEASTLQLSHVHYHSPDTSIVVDVRRISLRFSLSNLIKYQGGLERFVQSIAIIEPKVSYRLGGHSTPDTSTVELPDLSHYSFLERIIVREGTFRLSDRSGQSWASLHGIDGWVTGGHGRNVRFEVAASPFGDSLRTLTASGTVNLADLKLETKVDLARYKLANLDFPATTPIVFEDGNIDLHVRATVDSSGWQADANWMLKNGVMQVKHGPRLEGINLTGLLEDKLVTITGDLLFEEDPASLNASISLKDTLDLKAMVDIPEGRLGKHLGTFTGLKPKNQPGGNLHARAHFHLRAGEGWSAWATGSGRELTTPVGPFRNVSTDIHWDRQKKSLVFDRLNATWYGMAVDATASFNPGRDNRFPVDIDVNGNVDPTELPDWTHPLASKVVHGKVTLRLTPAKGWVIRSEGRVRNRGDARLGEFQGVYNRSDGYDLSLALYSAHDKDARFRFYSLKGEPVRIETVQPQLVAGWWDSTYSFSDRVKRLDITASARFDSGRVAGSADLLDDKTGFELALNGSLLHGQDTPYNGIYGYTLKRHEVLIGNGDVNFRLQDGLLDVDRFTFMDFFHATGRIDLKNREIAGLEMVVEDLDLAEVVPGLTSLPEGRVEGRINGRLSARGPFKQPVLQSHLELSEGGYGALRQYWGLLTLGSDVQGNVVIEQGAFGRAGRTMITLEGNYNIPEDDLNLSLSSPGSDASVLAQALFGKESLLDGTISLQGRVHGPILMPSWTMNLGMLDAQVAGIEFNTVSVALRGESSERLGHVLYIDEFDMSRPKHYQLQVFGAAPLTRGAGQISIVLNGAIPELLPQMTGFVKGARGTGEANWTITMVGGSAASSQGSVKVKNGSLTFAEVFPDMHDINIDMDVDLEGRATINRCEAKLGDENRRFVLGNDPGDPDDPTQLPILVKSLGLDLGVLRFRTPDADGIPMRIPGVSMTQDYANVRFTGLGDDSWFRVAGPVDSLMMRGEMTMNTADITLPPVSTKNGGNGSSRPGVSKKPTGFLALLYKARWDAEVNIGRDVHYERVVSGLEKTPLLAAFSDFIGQVSVDLTLEPTEQDRPLRVHGRLVDQSFRLGGTLTSTQGTIEFLDLTFQMERGEATFDQTSLLPVVSGRAVSNVVEPGTDFSRRVYLTLYVIDPVTGEKTPRGRWGDFTLVLEDEEGSSQEQIVTALGYDPASLRERATAIGAGGIERAVTRRWLRPIERDVARWLGLDLVRINPTIAQNLTSTDQTNLPGQVQDSVRTKRTVDYFRASRVTVGKYLTRDLFLSYTGQLGKDPRYTTVEDAQSGRIGLLQTWSLQYRLNAISPNFVIQGDWEYDNLADVRTAERQDKLRNNRSIRLKYTFVFDVTKLRWLRVW